MKKVLVTRRISEKALDLIRRNGYEVTVYTNNKNISQEKLIKMCKGHAALLSVGPNKIDKYFLEACSFLQGIALMSVGYDKVDVATATSLGMPISNTPDVLSEATADVAFFVDVIGCQKGLLHA
jgi:lactate dehydrogenase-like 2-hydroxyacid dehydrogenase